MIQVVGGRALAMLEQGELLQDMAIIKQTPDEATASNSKNMLHQVGGIQTVGVPFKKQLQTPVHQIERRANPRHKVQKSGVVTCKFSRQDYSCRVVNLSVTGATIETPAYAALTTEVTLLVIGERIIFDAEVVWKRGFLVGLKLTGEPKML